MYAIGTRVRRLWEDGVYYYGTVTQVSGDQVFVQFDDGDTAWLAFHEVEPEGGPGMMKGAMGAPMGGPGMMKGAMGAPMGGPGMMKGAMGAPMGGPGMMKGAIGAWTVGQRVMAQWSDGGWYPGIIGQVGGPDSYFIQFDDGDTGWVAGHQLQPLGGAPSVAFVVGMRVQKQWVDGNWYAGTIMEIAPDGGVFVQFDDGDTAWVSPQEIQPL